MSWLEAVRGWNEIYDESPKVRRFFEDAAPTIAKHGVSYFSGSPSAGEAVGGVLGLGSSASSGVKEFAGRLAYGAAVGLGTGVIGLAATALAPVWVPILIYKVRKGD